MSSSDSDKSNRSESSSCSTDPEIKKRRLAVKKAKETRKQKSKDKKRQKKLKKKQKKKEKKSKKKFEDRYGKLKPDLPDPVQE